MCATCGCSEPASGHDHPDDHSHDHDHSDHAAHSHEHHPHEHTAHSHAHHDHDHAEHSHEHHPGVGEHAHPAHLEPAGAAQTARTLRLEQDVLAKNNLLAERNRGWFEGREVLALNLMSSPGAGKTTLLERTIRDLGGEVPISVIEGDQATERDAERIRATGCPVVQINTGTGCHLDAAMVARGLQALAPRRGALVMIENVGNLVCPALFDLGEHAKVVIASVTEGEDKPLKYPHMFRAAALMILNKVDLLPYVAFDAERCIAYARQVNPQIRVVQLSATHGDGLEAWYGWLREALRAPSAAR